MRKGKNSETFQWTKILVSKVSEKVEKGGESGSGMERILAKTGRGAYAQNAGVSEKPEKIKPWSFPRSFRGQQRLLPLDFISVRLALTF